MALTSKGLVIPRYQELLDNLISLEKSKISASLKIADDELLGQFNQVIADIQEKIYALMEVVHNSTNIKAAFGSQLDVIGLIKNIPRLSSSPTQGYQKFTGDVNTIIPAGLVVENVDTGDRYVTRTSVSLSTLSAIAATVEVDTVTEGVSYTVSINSTPYTYVAVALDGSDEIYLELADLINADISSSIVANYDGNGLYLTEPNNNSFSITTSSLLSVPKSTVLGYVYSEVNGALSSSLGVVTRIITPVIGLDSTTNPYTFTEGSLRESDSDYRARLSDPTTITGKATIPAIRGFVQNVAGVTYATVVQNNTMVTDGDGIPPKAFHTIVAGGLDANVANAIFEAGGAGIETYGSITEVVVDDNQSHEIKFSRPTGVYFAVRVQYSKYTEETFPDDIGSSAITDSIVSHINGLGIGVDVIPKRMYEFVYNAVSGVGDCNIEIQTLTASGGTPVGGSWQDTTIAIASTEFAQIAEVDIIIEEV